MLGVLPELWSFGPVAGGMTDFDAGDIYDERDLFLVAMDVEGTLTPEAWLALQEKTGLEELKLTTAHEPDYDKLMKYRIDVLRKNNIKLQDSSGERPQAEKTKSVPGLVDLPRSDSLSLADSLGSSTEALGMQTSSECRPA